LHRGPPGGSGSNTAAAACLPQRLLNRLPVQTARDRCAIVRAARIGRGRSAVDVDLSSAELNRIAAELPKAAGERYTPEGMASVSS